MSEREKLISKISAMSTESLQDIWKKSREYDDDISEMLIRHIAEELEARKAG